MHEMNVVKDLPRNKIFPNHLIDVFKKTSTEGEFVIYDAHVRKITVVTS